MNDHIRNKMNEVVARIADMDMGRWVKEWKSIVPMNAEYKKPYRGFNSIIAYFCYDIPLFLSVNQCKKMGLNFQNLKTFPVTYWKVSNYEKTNPATGEKELKKGFMLRITPSFSISELAEINEGFNIEDYVSYNDNAPIEHFEALIAAHNVKVAPSQRAFYRPATDSLGMPNIRMFTSSEAYYHTYFHELVHWTKHASRLDRGNKTHGMDEYAYEELVAELGAIELSLHFGIEPSKNSLVYVKGWFTKIRDNEVKVDALMSAAAKAKKAVEFILSKAPEVTKEKIVVGESAEAQNEAA